MNVAASPLDPSGQARWLDGLIFDISERKAAEIMIRDLAFNDTLTGLPNRRLLLDRLDHELAISERTGRHGALLFIDLDNFKTINDTLGHAAGDQVLVEVARRLVASVRESDTVARLGGDEFVVILDNLGDTADEAAAEAAELGSKILVVLAQPYRLGEALRNCTPASASPPSAATRPAPAGCSGRPIRPCTRPSRPAATSCSSIPKTHPRPRRSGMISGLTVGVTTPGLPRIAPLGEAPASIACIDAACIICVIPPGMISHSQQAKPELNPPVSRTYSTPRLPPVSLAWFTWGLLASLYFVGFFQRVAPAVMVDELMRDFSIAATMLGNLSAIYFYAYAAMQIPSGLLADAVGPRRVATAAAVAAVDRHRAVCPGGHAVDGQPRPRPDRRLGRRRLRRLHEARRPLVSRQPLRHRHRRLAADRQSRRRARRRAACPKPSPALAGAAPCWPARVVTLLLAIAVWLWVRDDPSDRGYASHAHPEALNTSAMSPRRSLKIVASERETWLLFFAGGLDRRAGAHLRRPLGGAVSGAGARPGTQPCRGLHHHDAARVRRRRPVAGRAVRPHGPAQAAVSGRGARPRRLCWGVFLFVDALPDGRALSAVRHGIGFSAGGIIIGFAFAREANHPGAAGTVGGVVNMAVLGFAAIQQSAMGWILDRNWQGAMVDGARIYDAAAYHAAFRVAAGQCGRRRAGRGADARNPLQAALRFSCMTRPALQEKDQQHHAQQQPVDHIGQHPGAFQQADEEVDAQVGADGGQTPTPAAAHSSRPDRRFPAGRASPARPTPAAWESTAGRKSAPPLRA
jgi:diguanylate cyclase (GGDEF)-like protein